MARALKVASKRDRIVARAELRDRLLTPGVGSALTELDQPDENPPRNLDLNRILDLESLQDPVGMAGDGDLESGALLAVMTVDRKPCEARRIES